MAEYRARSRLYVLGQPEHFGSGFGTEYFDQEGVRFLVDVDRTGGSCRRAKTKRRRYQRVSAALVRFHQNM
jgi:hypothetical protein